MTDIEIIDCLNFIAKELSPDAQVQFDQRDWGIYFSRIIIQNLIQISKQELEHNNFDSIKLAALMKYRMMDAYHGLIDFAQKQIDKLEGKT